MKVKNGFTLIELVAVIVVLSILVAIATPKFINLNDDARTATLKGVAAALKGGSGMAHSLAIIHNQNGSTGEISISGSILHLVHGYPVATSNALNLISSLHSDDWVLIPDDGKIQIGHEGFKTDGNCNVKYEEAEIGESPRITVFPCE